MVGLCMNAEGLAGECVQVGPKGSRGETRQALTAMKMKMKMKQAVMNLVGRV
jgi:hypothetical protein